LPLIFSKPPRNRFPDNSGRPPFALKIDGISTERTPGRGYKDLAEATYLSWLAWHSLYLRAESVKEVFQSGVLKLRGIAAAGFSETPSVSSPL
jgi:hypothetical protein